MILCSYCQKYFKAYEGFKNCTSCTLFGGCQKIKCPYCSYEMPKIEGEKNAGHKPNGFKTR